MALRGLRVGAVERDGVLVLTQVLGQVSIFAFYGHVLFRFLCDSCFGVVLFGRVVSAVPLFFRRLDVNFHIVAYLGGNSGDRRKGGWWCGFLRSSMSWLCIHAGMPWFD